MSYRHLDAVEVDRTARRLASRIEERLPGRGLCEVARDVAETASEAADAVRRAREPIMWIRVMTGLVALLLTALLVWGIASLLRLPPGELDRLAFLGVTEAAVNEVLLLGAGVLFLVSTERRVKRRDVLRRLSELRSLAHVVDMHQLSKDADHAREVLDRTSSSPPRESLSLPMLARYLDYCSELLAIIGKVSALYAQDIDDDVVLEVVAEIEGLCASISRTIWQKIQIIATLEDLSAEA